MSLHNINFDAIFGTDKYRQFLADWNGGIDPRLKAIIIELTDYTMIEYSHGLTITSLNRSFVPIGSNPKSAHFEGRAADIRSRTFTAEQSAVIVKRARVIWGSKFLHIIHHDSGNGEHFHLNINYPFKRNGWRNGGSYGT